MMQENSTTSTGIKDGPSEIRLRKLAIVTALNLQEHEAAFCAARNSSTCEDEFLDGLVYREVVLNAEGVRGLIVDGPLPGALVGEMCGSGGCGFFVLKQRYDGYELVLNQLGGSLRVSESSTNGYYDLIVNGGTAAFPEQTRYVWNGSEYAAQDQVPTSGEVAEVTKAESTTEGGATLESSKAPPGSSYPARWLPASVLITGFLILLVMAPYYATLAGIVFLTAAAYGVTGGPVSTFSVYEVIGFLWVIVKKTAVSRAKVLEVENGVQQPEEQTQRQKPDQSESYSASDEYRTESATGKEYCFACVRYYAVLRLKPDASDTEVKAAHRYLTQINHPDRFEGKGPIRQIAEDQTKEINEAYSHIKTHFAQEGTP